MKCEWGRGYMRKERRGRSNEMRAVERVHTKRDAREGSGGKNKPLWWKEWTHEVEERRGGQMFWAE